MGMDTTIQQLSEAQQTQGIADEAVNAQIDNLILDNRKKLNAIIGKVVLSRVTVAPCTKNNHLLHRLNSSSMRSESR